MCRTGTGLVLVLDGEPCAGAGVGSSMVSRRVNLPRVCIKHAGQALRSRARERYYVRMSTQRDVVVDVRDFDREVLLRSHEVPVLVDFWAAWCGPCRALSPVLEKLAVELAGTFVLAKVNVDQHQRPAAEYGVRSIPDVKLFIGGKVKAGFMGALPEPRVREFLRKNCPSEADLLVAQGKKLLEQGDAQAAQDVFARAVELDPACNAAHLALAQVALGRRDVDAVKRHVKALSPGADEREIGRYLEQAAELVQGAAALGDETTLAGRVAAQPDDLEARFALGCHAMAAGRMRDALDALVAVAERNRKWRDEAARKAMLTVFGLIGVRHPLSDEYRKKLMFIY